ncbi:MAG: hypothetical protein WBI53_10465 [Paludibacter sp.]
MGSFSHLFISDYPTFTAKNSYLEELVKLIFLPEDYIEEERKNSSLNKLIWGNSYENDEGVYTFRGFRQSVKNCKSRLEIYGVSPRKAKNEFQRAKRIALRDSNDADICYGFPINKISYEAYLAEIHGIIETKEINYEQSYDDFRNSLITGEFEIYGQELKYCLYSILSVVPENDIVEYDMSDIIEYGWIKEYPVECIDIEKIIILTEGKTDVEFISASLSYLYPHLYSYYHFIDFDEFKVESNASALVKLIISFAASNVKHPIIALFDNDTAGIKEMKKLDSVKLPDNIKVLKLPDTKLAKSYPTVGPTGFKKMNINGLACGIEMYLGIDVLTKEDKLIHIQWKGYDEKEKKYQGDLSEKHYVQEVFRKKIKTDRLELTEMKILLTDIFNALK